MLSMFSNPSRAIYGTITVGALLAAESARAETYLETVGAVVIALVVYWIAHSYSESAARRLQNREALGIRELARSMAHEVSILTGGAIPLVVVLIGWAVGASLNTAVTAAVWSSAATILLIETVAAIRAHLTGRALYIQITLGALLGMMVILLRLILH
jgi:hypothetical protein